MSGFTFGQFAWLLLPLIPALIALYFLKLKRQPRVVSSTFLWARTLEDLHVNAPFQKMRKSLLLLLQLLVLGFLIFACSKPLVEGTGQTGISRVILIDRSASMGVLENGESRLSLAQTKALDLINALEPGDLTAVVTFSNRPVTMQSMTSDRGRLERAIRRIELTDLPTEFPTALQTAASLLAAAENGEVVVISDGAFGDLTNLGSELELVKLRYIPIGEETSNQGIIELDAATSFSQEKAYEIFASVYNSAEEKKSVTLSLYDGEDLVDATQLEIEPGKIAPHVFDGAKFAGQTLKLQIEPGGALKADDEAWIHLALPKPLEVLVVGAPNHFLDLVLRANPQLRARRITIEAFETLLKDDSKFQEDPAQVIIFDRQCPKSPSLRPAIYIDCHPDYSLKVAAESEEKKEGADTPVEATGPSKIEAPSIVDWDATHPVNRYNNYADLLISESRRPGKIPGYHSIIESAEDSLAGVVTYLVPGSPAASHVILNFNVLNTNWAWLPSFPKFFYSASAFLGEAALSTEMGRFRCGQALTYYPPKKAEENQSSYTLKTPQGSDVPLKPEKSGEVIFPDTYHRGLYRLEEDGEFVHQFAVSLLSRKEADIAAAKEVRIGVDRIATADEIPQSKELWPWAAALALAFVLTEWWVYNRRMTL